MGCINFMLETTAVVGVIVTIVMVGGLVLIMCFLLYWSTQKALYKVPHSPIYISTYYQKFIYIHTSVKTNFSQYLAQRPLSGLQIRDIR